MVASGAASGAVSDTRRNVLLGAGAALTGLAMPVMAKAPAAPNPLDRLLKTALPPEIRALIPGEVFEAGQFVSSLIALESEAGKLKLPPSKLSFGEAPLPNSLDRLYELAMPRLANPRKVVPARSLAVTGEMCAVYPWESPGGWNLLGRTPVPLFEAAEETAPALLESGDQVRWRVVDRAEYEHIAGELAAGRLSRANFHIAGEAA